MEFFHDIKIHGVFFRQAVFCVFDGGGEIEALEPQVGRARDACRFVAKQLMKRFDNHCVIWDVCVRVIDEVFNLIGGENTGADEIGRGVIIDKFAGLWIFINNGGIEGRFFIRNKCARGGVDMIDMRGRVCARLRKRYESSLERRGHRARR